LEVRRGGEHRIMPDLLKLSVKAVDLATLPARFALRTAFGLLHRGDDAPAEEHAPPPAAAAPVPPPPVRPAPARPARRRTAARPKPSPKAARRAARGEPTKGQAAAMRESLREEEQNAGGPGPGATIEIAPPWEDYDALTEDQVLDRLTGADAAVRAAVRFYEGANGGRRQIVLATDAPVAE
jgi:hypothetical protein